MNEKKIEKATNKISKKLAMKIPLFVGVDHEGMSISVSANKLELQYAFSMMARTPELRETMEKALEADKIEEGDEPA